jgi:hypothetical protein
LALLLGALHGATLAQWVTPQKKIFLNQIFEAKLRYLKSGSTPTITLKKGKNLILVGRGEVKDGELYQTQSFFFKARAQRARLPDATIISSTYKASAKGSDLSIHTLNPPPNFTNVLAKDLHILSYEAIQYSKNENMVVLYIQAKLANLEDFTIPFAKKEGVKERNLSFPISTITHYAIISASLDELRLSYFDSNTYEFRSFMIPVKVADESVSTQSDIKPTESKNKKIKIAIALVATLLFLALFFFKKSLPALLAALLFAAIGGYLAIPLKKVCLKRGGRIYILPTRQSTIFKINPQHATYEELNRVGGYVKIKLSDQKVGWVKDEDLCQD